MAGPRQPRRQWSPPRVEDVGDPAREEAVLGGAAGAGRRGDDALSAEQRRAVWEEQRAAADRNRRAAHEVSPSHATHLVCNSSWIQPVQQLALIMCV